MASGNIERFGSRQNAYKVIGHNSADTRPEHLHENPHIQVEKIKDNWSIGEAKTYTERCKRLNDRLNELDSTTNKNKRSDRCEMFGLEAPIPKDLPADKVVEWCKRYHKHMCDFFGEKNVIYSEVHVDEVHDYKNAETGKWETSRIHIHMGIVPEIGGQINSKKVLARSNIFKMHDLEEEFTQKEFGIRYQDGSKKKSRDTVGALKNKSLKLENEELQEQNTELKRTRKQLRADIVLKQSELAQIQTKINQGQSDKNELQRQLRAIQIELQALQEEKEDYLAFRAERRKKREQEQKRSQMLSDTFGEVVNVHNHKKCNGKQNDLEA